MNEDLKIKLYTDMLRIRRMEELCAELYTKEKIRGFLHLYVGEEAVAAGVMNHLQDQDNVMSTYREHAHALLKGISAREIFSELFGKKTGCSHGRGGSMHLFSKKHRFFGGSAIVASGIPQAVGLALSAKKLGEERMTVCFFGEGAMAEGVFYEAINMASLWKIPLLFCCENNFYAMGTALTLSQAQSDLVLKAKAFGLEGMAVDGMNALEVFEETRKAMDYIRNEKRPFFLEFKTYRFRAHSMFDPELYRTKEEVDSWKIRCPILSLKAQLFKENSLTPERELNIQNQVDEEMMDAIGFADSSLFESEASLFNHLYEEKGASHETHL
jgi:pyruvate dehydrogenase E1 component alpha subunit